LAKSPDLGKAADGCLSETRGLEMVEIISWDTCLV